MNKLFILFGLILISSCCGNNENKIQEQDANNINITNNEFKYVIRNFYAKAIYYNENSKNNIISIFLSKNNEDIEIDFFAFKRLEKKYFIGESNLDCLKILFYTDDLASAKSLIEIKYIKKDIISEDQVIDLPYRNDFIFRNGKFFFQTLNGLVQISPL